MFNPAHTADEIKKTYIGYINTTFHFRNQNLQRKLIETLDKTVSKGPYIEIKDSFKSGKSIQQLIEDGVLSNLFRDLESSKKYPPKIPISRPLYLHQEKAVKKIVSGKNVVVSTGTGSGKTNCFLIPIINELLREKEQGQLNDGVRAIFIYPMNALANDQIKGLREILMAYPDIRFGVYNGGTENREEDATKLYKAMNSNEKYPELRETLPNEEVSRDRMKQHPPHILFTNYAMLEHMLFRPGDDTIFSSSNFKFVVLDEAHVYTGATGIETAFLMGRLKGRLSGEREPQFILTSATLGDGSHRSNKKVVEFAECLTGCTYNVDDIITADRDDWQKSSTTYQYPVQLFIDLANKENFFHDVLKKYSLDYTYTQDKEPEILYDIISSCSLYAKMRTLDGVSELNDFTKYLQLSNQEIVSFVALCAKARKNGKPLIDIRYHYFLRALDGCYLALDYDESLSLIRKDYFNSRHTENAKMFEIAICQDCGEVAIIGKIEHGKLVRANVFDERSFYQVYLSSELYEDEQTECEKGSRVKQKKGNKHEDIEYYLCKSCGAIVSQDEVHNSWCTCGDTQKIKIKKLNKNHCLNCDGSLRSFNLGYDAATGVVATALYEQIPEYTFTMEEVTEKQPSRNRFLQKIRRKKNKSKTGSQFLIFSDSRQGAAKFACYLNDSYKEFLRRRGIWNVVTERENDYKSGITISEFVSLLDNYYSGLKLFRSNNANIGELSVTENRRNAWVAVLNELYNCNRDTSLVSLGKISFAYLGNSDDIIEVVVADYGLSKEDAENFLNYLAFEIVRSAAIVTDKITDISSSDREYLFFSPYQKVITKDKDNSVSNSQGFMPTARILKSGEMTYYRSNKLLMTKKVLKLNDEEAVGFLESYWGYLVSDDNTYKLQSDNNGESYVISANHFRINLGKNATLWKCKTCGKVTQFNIGENCIQLGCEGQLERFNSEEFCRKNYYAMLYQNKKMTPLFVKEHTAQLSKKEALDYQQQFIRKEINALSCSTTFEMGVDVGDLETVFLRNIPPLASNYAQRVGRAGRSIDAAAFALTFARLSSHDFTFFDRPREMIAGVISPPCFNLNNEKILKRHVYAIALSLYLKMNPDMYGKNSAEKFVNEKGYQCFFAWLQGRPSELTNLLKASIANIGKELEDRYINDFAWLEDFIGEQGILSKIIGEFEQNVDYLKKEYEKAMRAREEQAAAVFNRKLKRYQKNDFIDFLVRGNILPKYGFPIDSVELTQNLTAPSFKSLNLSRDLSVAIAEYAPSSEVVADGGLYTSRYIRKPIIKSGGKKGSDKGFDVAHLAECPDCQNVNYSKMPVESDGRPCTVCGTVLKRRDFKPSIEPRSGFVAEEEVKGVPLRSQERKYKTEAIYIGSKAAHTIGAYEHELGGVKLAVESLTSDSLVVKSTNRFYVCSMCGYSIASDEESKLGKYEDYRFGAERIEKTTNRHDHPFGKGKCDNTLLRKYMLHHEFKTDVAKILFDCDTSNYATMLSVMYALLNSFTQELSIERRDVKACLTFKRNQGKMTHGVIIYDSVPGGAGHSRRLVTKDGEILRAVIKRAIDLLDTCECSPSCYRCLRNYENQKIHEILDRESALEFLKQLGIRNG